MGAAEGKEGGWEVPGTGAAGRRPTAGGKGTAQIWRAKSRSVPRWSQEGGKKVGGWGDGDEEGQRSRSGNRWGLVAAGGGRELAGGGSYYPPLC